MTRDEAKRAEALWRSHMETADRLVTALGFAISVGQSSRHRRAGRAGDELRH